MHFARIGDAAEILDVSEGLLRKLIAQGKIPSYKLSEKTTRVDLDELRNYMRVIVIEGNSVVDGKVDKKTR
jgi:excisionase family DNA binding protein